MVRTKGSKNKNPIPPMKRFWPKVMITDNCWEWTASKNPQGYGLFLFKSKYYPAHRFMWLAFHGTLPENMCVCHHCDNPSCVNPKHLFLGTHRDNMDDMLKKNRQRNGISLGEAHGATSLRNEDIWEIKRLYKTGKLCHREIARMFLIDRKTVGNIVNRITWKHI